MAFDLDVREGAGFMDYKQESSFNFDQELFDNCPDHVSLYGFSKQKNTSSILKMKLKKILHLKSTFGKRVKSHFHSKMLFHYIFVEQIMFRNKVTILCVL